MNPRARKDGLLVEELANETLVYDLERHKAHCLNQTAKFVWSHCDGQTSIGELAELLQDEFRSSANEEVVWLALERLEKAHLLRERVRPQTETPRYSRRRLLTRLGIGMAIPVVVSIVAPMAVHAASCVTVTTCETVLNPGQCSTEIPICGEPGECCGREGSPPECKKHSCP